MMDASTCLSSIVPPMKRHGPVALDELCPANCACRTLRHADCNI
jgi:hypothetical protein